MNGITDPIHVNNIDKFEKLNSMCSRIYYCVRTAMLNIFVTQKQIKSSSLSNVNNSCHCVYLCTILFT